MTISLVIGQLAGTPTDSATSGSVEFPGNVTAGNLITIQVSAFKPSNDAFVVGDITKSAGTATLGAFTLDRGHNFNYTGTEHLNTAVFSCLVTGSGSCTINVGGAPAGSFFNVTCSEWSSTVGWDAARVEAVNSAQAASGAPDSGNATSVGNGLYIGGVSTATSGSTTHTQDGSFTLIDEEENGAAHITGAGIYRIVSAGTTDSASWTAPTTVPYAAVVVLYREAAVAAITGTATATITEADVVTGGKTIIATLTNDTYVVASVTTAITQPASANGGTASTTSFSITLPTTQANDILILEFCHRGTGLGTIAGTSVSVGGLTWTHKNSQTFAAGAFSGQMYWTRATGNHGTQTVTGASLTNSCAAIVKVKRGCVESGDPFTNAATIVGEENASANETQAQITTLIDGADVNFTVLNSPDLAVSTHACTSPGALADEVEVLSTGGTDTSISSACAVKASAGATGSFTWAQTDAASGSYAYALEPKVTTPFADARAAIRDGIDSAQAEAAGWDAKVKPNIPLGNIVRTSGTVCTITLQAQADYDITAQETITVTVPASALTGGVAIVGTPTFTVDTSGGAPADPEGSLIHGKLLGGGLLITGVLIG
jgi:hypothetical protein